MSECKDITKAIEELSNKIDSYKKEVKEKFNQLNFRIDSLENKTNALDQDIKKIIPRVNSHETRITRLERDPFTSSSSDKNKINFLKQQIQRLQQQIRAIERYINALDSAGKRINSILKNFSRIFSFLK